MVDEVKLQRDTSRAFKAAELLENELFNEAIANIEADLIKAWKDSPGRDTDGRERCWAAVQQVGKIKAYFETVLSSGKLSSAQLKQLTEQPKRFGIV